MTFRRIVALLFLASLCAIGAQVVSQPPMTIQQVNKFVYVDGVKYKTIQSCVTAAAALSSPGTCIVPTGTPNTSQVEMASGVNLEFASGTFVNTGTGGGVFIHFGSSIVGGSVKGRGIGSTVLKNNSTGSQFGAVVQDEGTDDSISDLTMDGNGNSTDTMIHVAGVVRPHVHKVKIIADAASCLSSGGGRSYGWDFRSGSELDASDIEAVGGQQDAIQFGAFATDTTTITGGRLVNVYAHDSCHNGMDIKAQGSSGYINGLEISNARFIHNGLASGTAGDTMDDNYGFNAVATLSVDGSSISNLLISNIVATGNTGSGIRIKGDVHESVIQGIISESNGGGTGDTDAVAIVSGAGTTAPVRNIFSGIARKGSATNALSTDANTQANTFEFNVGADAVSFGNGNDFYRLQTATGGQQAIGPLYLGITSASACKTAPSITNVTGAGICLNGATVYNPSGPINAQSFGIGSTPGFSGTKVAGACTLTISGGIITGVSGC